MCEKVVEKEAKTLPFVPRHFVTQKIRERTHDACSGLINYAPD